MATQEASPSPKLIAANDAPAMVQLGEQGTCSYLVIAFWLLLLLLLLLFDCYFCCLTVIVVWLFLILLEYLLLSCVGIIVLYSIFQFHCCFILFWFMFFCFVLFLLLFFHSLSFPLSSLHPFYPLSLPYYIPPLLYSLSSSLPPIFFSPSLFSSLQFSTPPFSLP